MATNLDDAAAGGRRVMFHFGIVDVVPCGEGVYLVEWPGLVVSYVSGTDVIECAIVAHSPIQPTDPYVALYYVPQTVIIADVQWEAFMKLFARVKAIAAAKQRREKRAA